jgi:signal transduction histidine kinase
VPLFEKESIIGALVLGCDQAGASEDQIKVIVASANQAAIAIENHRLYHQMREAVMSEERNRLARDLHDSVTQSLFSATLLADVLPQIWQRDPEQGLQRLEKLRRLMRGALAEMRSMLLELRPSAVINAPLADLLAQLTEAIASRSGLPFQLYLEQIPALPEEVQTSFYRIAQEALNNVVKHAQAKQVTVSLSETLLPPEAAGGTEREVKLVIRDDGVGYSTGDEKSTHLGISIMRERAAAIQASLALESQPGHGTQVILIWHAEAESEP